MDVKNHISRTVGFIFMAASDACRLSVFLLCWPRQQKLGGTMLKSFKVLLSRRLVGNLFSGELKHVRDGSNNIARILMIMPHESQATPRKGA